LSLFNRGPENESNLVTYYLGEDDLHPKIQGAFEWFKEDVLPFFHNDCQDKIMLAGGALRSLFTDTSIRDYDVYADINTIEKLSDNHYAVLASKHGGWTRISNTARSYTYKRMFFNPLEQKIDHSLVNFIKTPYVTPQSVIETFDFTVCMCAITKDQITYHPDYFVDLATRVLRVNSLEDPLSTLWRVQKYNKLGYTMSQEEMWKTVEAVHDLGTLPRIVDEGEKTKASLKENVMTLEEVFRSS